MPTGIHCILPINVLPKPKSTKLRLIIDGSPLVPYALKRKFKLEQIWKEGRELFAGCTHGSVIDISNDFFHIEIVEESKSFLGFEWLGVYYQFISLPQGDSRGPVHLHRGYEVRGPSDSVTGATWGFGSSNTIFQAARRASGNSVSVRVTCSPVSGVWAG